MPRIQTNVRTVGMIYDEAFKVVKKSRRCPKCWAMEFAFKCFGRQTQVYTAPHADGSGIWVFDVDAARGIAGERIDASIAPAVLLKSLGETEEGHEVCLLKRVLADNILPPVGPVGVIVTLEYGHIVIDGTHRGRLCLAAGVAMPVAVLTPDETDRVTLLRPPNDVSEQLRIESERLYALFSEMDADYFFSEMTRLLGSHRLAQLIDDGNRV